MKILIVKLGSIGDIVHALPALAAIRRQMPDAEIGWAVDSRSAEILRGNPFIDTLIELDTRSLRGGKVIEGIALDIGKQLRALRQDSWDIALDMQGLIKSAVFARMSGAPKRWGFAKDALREPAGRVFLTDTVEIPARTHVIIKNLLLAEGALGLEPARTDFEFPIQTDDSHRAEADAIESRVGAPFAILNPAGGWTTKLWPAENFGRLADRLFEEFGIMSVITTAPTEAELAERAGAASRSGKMISAQPTLKGFYELSKRSAVYVGGDTGPTHIAVAAAARVVGIFGPTEWWRNGSINPDDICVERTDIGCRVECHRRSCDNWICMDIDVRTVADAVGKRLAGGPVTVGRQITGQAPHLS